MIRIKILKTYCARSTFCSDDLTGESDPESNLVDDRPFIIHHPKHYTSLEDHTYLKICNMKTKGENNPSCSIRPLYNCHFPGPIAYASMIYCLKSPVSLFGLRRVFPQATTLNQARMRMKTSGGREAVTTSTCPEYVLYGAVKQRFCLPDPHYQTSFSCFFSQSLVL